MQTGFRQASSEWQLRKDVIRGEYGNPLRAGQIILSGALGPMVPTPPDTRVRAELGPLGSFFDTLSRKEGQ